LVSAEEFSHKAGPKNSTGTVSQDNFAKARQRRTAIRWAAMSEERPVWLCRAHLWLLSSDARRKPYRLQLHKGIACNAEQVGVPDPERHRALIGTRLLIRHGLRMECDFADRTFSLWSPDR
jgi:hypothetical protein